MLEEASLIMGSKDLVAVANKGATTGVVNIEGREREIEFPTYSVSVGRPSFLLILI